MRLQRAGARAVPVHQECSDAPHLTSHSRWTSTGQEHRTRHRSEPCHPAALDPGRAGRAVRVSSRAAKRAGGQNRNKVETAVILTHRPTGFKAQASERRTQGENRRAALQRLRLELALTVRRPIAAMTRHVYSPARSGDGGAVAAGST